MTSEEKQALIEYCEREIEKFKLCISEYPDAPVLRSDLKLHEIAIAALTAQPVKLPDILSKEFHDYGGNFEYSLYERAMKDSIRAAGYEVQE